MSKRRYRIRNWRDYNKALIHRGDIDLWFDSRSIKRWYCTQKSGRRGRSYLYSSMAIQCMSLVKAVFHLPLRGTQGFMMSMSRWLKLPLQVPYYSTLSRRQKKLPVKLSPRFSRNGPLHIVVDGTGLKVYGEGEWKVRQHGYSKRRTWRKLHLAVDTRSHSIMASVVTTSDVQDNEVTDDLLDQIKGDIAQVTGDGMYDKWPCYKSIESHKAIAVIPPQKNAKIKQHGNNKAPPLMRDQAIREIRRVGLKNWKVAHAYHQRSLVETAIFRFKKLFGTYVSARLFDHQATELFIKCCALNRMTKLGMPDSVAIV